MELQDYVLQVKDNDQGFLIKEFGERGWGLFNMQSLDIQYAGEIAKRKAEVIAKAETKEKLIPDENINEKELYLLRVAALYHDTGFLYKYKDHESKSCEIFLEDSKQFTFTDSDKRIIVDLIMATRVPQQPKTLLQRIICDADLDYLGRHDFDVIAAKLKSEFFNFGIVSDENDWHTLQKMFLENHSYHTSSSQLLREPVKKENLSKIKKKDS